MDEAVLARLACALFAHFFLTIASVLSAASLFISWWTPGPYAPKVIGVSAEERQQVERLGLGGDDPGLNSEITLWGHIGCAGNESWSAICSLSQQDCTFNTTTTQLKEWRPITTIITTSALPTLDPDRATTTKKTGGSDWACASSPDCDKKVITTLDPEAVWGPSPSAPGDGQNYGDSLSRVVQEGTVTAEKPANQPSTPPATKVTTTIPVPTQSPIGIIPGQNKPVVAPESDTPNGLWDAINDQFFPRGNPITTMPLDGSVDPLAKPYQATTEAPQRIVGVEQTAALCPLARDDEKSRRYVCDLRPQCEMITQARSSAIAALAFAGLGGGAMLLFGGGGGGMTRPTKQYPDGRPAPTKHSMAFAAALFATLNAALLIVALSVAGGVQVVHSMDGPGTSCAGVAVAFSVLASLCAMSAALLAKKFPGRDLTEEELNAQKKSAEQAQAEIDPEVSRKVLEEEYPGLRKKFERTMAVRLAWQPPPALEYLQDLEAEEGEAPQPEFLRTTAVSEELPRSSTMLALPPQPEKASPSSPVQEKSLQRFFQGDGAVYAHRLYGKCDDYGCGGPSSPSSSCSTALSTSRSSFMPPGWEMVSSSKGEAYYYNRDTGESQWEHPAPPWRGASPTAQGSSWPASPSWPGSPMSWGAGESFYIAATGSLTVHPGNPMSSSAGFSYKKKRSRKTGQVYSVRVRD